LTYRAATLAALATLGLTCGLQPALALSPEAARIATSEAQYGCEGPGGRFSAKGAIERDLTGDGKPDLLINHDELTCSSSIGRSGSCGAAACTVKIFVREGTRLREVLDILSASVEIGPGSPPRIELSRGPNSHAYRWNGRAFK
jgi:hypothetical protein